MQVTKGTWRMREQCVPGPLSFSPAREPGNEAMLLPAVIPWDSIQQKVFFAAVKSFAAAVVAAMTAPCKYCAVVAVAAGAIFLAMQGVKAQQ